MRFFSLLPLWFWPLVVADPVRKPVQKIDADQAGTLLVQTAGRASLSETRLWLEETSPQTAWRASDRQPGTGMFAWTGGGYRNKASGLYAAVSGGESNDASGIKASISGGGNNEASGGTTNTASGSSATVTGGRLNLADLNDSVLP